MKYVVSITRKEGLADPEGATTTAALRDLGYHEIQGVHFGRTITLDVADGTSSDRIDEMCRRLLANPVIENFSIEEA
jgi:phosphoribosylformylglycinamidine synthase